MEIQNLRHALIYAERRLGVKKRGFHEGAHGKLAYWVAMPDGGLAVLCFKRDWLHTFSKLFPKWQGKGWGQTMNLNLLKEAANRFALVLIVTPDGTIYAKEAKDWLYLANKHESIRQPSTEEELEASIPARELDRLFPP